MKLKKGEIAMVCDVQQQRVYDAEALFLDKLRKPPLSRKFLKFDQNSFEQGKQFIDQIRKIALERFRVKLYDRPIHLQINFVCFNNTKIDLTVGSASGVFLYNNYNNNTLAETSIGYNSDDPFVKLTLLHEMSHWINMCMYPSGQEYSQVPFHGEQFTAIYLWIINEILGKDVAVIMFNSMKEMGVLVDGGLLRINGMGWIISSDEEDKD
jgi:hypothetical protein